MMRFAALAVALATAITSPAQPTPLSTLTDQDAYAVYGSALVNLRRDLPRVALLAETRPDRGCSAHVPPGWEEVAAAHERANTQRLLLLAGFDFGLPYRLVSGDEMATVTQAEDEWREQQLFERIPPVPSPFARFPGAKVYMVSAVGFSADRTRAMFMLQHTCGFNCWHGDQIVRVKVRGEWIDPVEVRERCTWVS